MKQKFREVKLSKKNQEKLELINSIIEDYQEDGYTLTLRQLYYQLVSKDLIPNEQKEYAKLSRLLKEGRMGGIVDWDAIEDRLRKIKTVGTWDSPKQILSTAANTFKLDHLSNQNIHLEVWVEKDALSQVVERAAQEYQVPVLVNRGYGSVSAIYNTYERINSALEDKEQAIVLYLGDHDPSGLDMVRDIKDRVCEMLEYDYREDEFQIKHIALTQAQIRKYNPPPNPAKVSDPRATDYINAFGKTSWEVDALPPDILHSLIIDNIEQYLDLELIEEIRTKESGQSKKIKEFIKQF